MSKIHMVFGGRVSDPQGLDFDLDSAHVVGLFPDYESALDAWRANAQRTVDDAEMKYVVVHLHRLLEPDLAQTPTSESGAPIAEQQKRLDEQQAD